MSVFLFALVEVAELHIWFFCFVGVADDHFDDFIHHPTFLVSEAILFELLNLWEILAKFTVEPHSNLAFFINAHLLLADVEAPDFVIEFLVAFEHGHDAVEVVWEGDVFELAEAPSDMVEIGSDWIGGGTELSSLMGLVVEDPHNERLVLPPLERFHVEIVVVLGGHIDVVFVDEFACMNIF